MSDQSPLKLAATNIRAELKQNYPGVKFSVRSRYFANGNSISIAWTGSPSTRSVNLIARKYEEGTFNGMTDSYEHDDDPQHVEFRRLRGSTKYVTLHRRSAL